MSNSSLRYLLDTNVFNVVFKNRVSVEEFRGVSLLVTHVQAGELRATRDAATTAGLLAVFEQIGPEETPTRSAVFDVSKWDKACWPDEDGVFDRMLARLQALDTASGKKPRDPANQSRDILIAETAAKNELTLVSDDENLRCVTVEFGGSAIMFAQLRARIRRSS